MLLEMLWGMPRVRQKDRGVTSVFMRAVLLICFLFACVASCASQKDMVHLNKQVNALYRQTKEDGERSERIIGELEEILKEHEDEQWELRMAIGELEYKLNEFEELITQQNSRQSELEQQLVKTRELQEAERTQLEEMLKARDTEQDKKIRELERSFEIKEAKRTQLEETFKAWIAQHEEMLKARDTEQEAKRQEALEVIKSEQDSLRTTIAQLQADLLGVRENIQVLTGQIEENNYLIKSTIEKDTTKTDVMASQLNELSLITEDFRLITEDFRSRLEVLEDYVSAEIEAKKQDALQEKSSPPEQKGETESPAPQQRELTESELYDRALGYYRDGRHTEAMADFNDFLRRYPESQLADNAHFWIGESYRAQGEYEQAILAYQKVINDYPKGNKVPVAMLHQGLAFEKIEDPTTADLVFKKLVKEFPKTREAEIAQKRLQRTR
ncbi:MAG: tol-pal system protein YbgF [Deltaproteobacteria bacterium]|nr:MAG: tol-pal system protein YbgF [Deltaproteobacteria bacterium]